LNSIEETVTTPKAEDGAQPLEESTQPAESGEHAGHSHENHDHGPTLNPECTRNVEVEVPAAEVSSAFARVLKQYRRKAQLPGFRAGKVPEAVLRRKFADSVRQDVLEDLLPSHFRAALEKEKLQPVSQPQVTSLHLVEGEPMRFQAAFEVLPAIEIAGYDQVKVERPDTALTDAEFDAELNQVRESHATMEPVEEDRVLTDGDVAQIQFTGQIHDDAPAGTEGDNAPQPIRGDDANVEIGGNNTVEGFSEALRGKKAGDQASFEVTYPAEFPERRLADKTVSYDVEIKAIRKKLLPELDDAFAKQMGEYESFDAFKTQLREHMANDKRRRLEGEAKDKLLAGLVERFQFPVPESLLQQQIDARLERGLRALAAQGMKTEQMRQLDFGRLRAAQRDSALNEVKGSLILDRIAEAENISVSDEDMETQLQLLSYQTREPLETMRKRLTDDGGLARIREQLRREKTVDQLFDRLTA
jgi:trigger factor